MTRLKPLRPDDMDQEARTLYQAILAGPRSDLTDEHGSLRGPFDPLLRSPKIGEAVQQLGAAIRFNGSLPDDLRELAILATAGHWNCKFELITHGPIAEHSGIDAEVVIAIGSGQLPDLVSGSDQDLVYRAVNELHATKRLCAETYEALVVQLGEALVIELVVVAGYYSLLAMVLEGFEITP
jgi:4-carboxymuconolactone decarboxylase